MRYKVCVHCDSDFMQESPNQRYCSVRCKEAGGKIVKKASSIRTENRIKNAKRSMEWKSKNYIKYRFNTIKHRAAKENVPFSLELQDLVVPEVCPVFGFVMDGSTRECQWSVDRLIPEKGYTKDNIQIISMKANRLKNNATLEDLKKIVRYLESYSS